MWPRGACPPGTADRGTLAQAPKGREREKIMWNVSEKILAVVVALAVTGPALKAQPQLPYNKGQWAGPYSNFEFQLPGNGSTHEIAHLAVLPPPPSDRSLSRVFLWNRINTPGNQCEPAGDPSSCTPPPVTGLYGRGFSLNTDRPGPMAVVPVGATNPGYDSSTGAQSLFCGGQTFLSDGSLLLAGGTDRVQQCQSNNCQSGLNTCGFGHSMLLRLETAVDPPVWDILETQTLGSPYWYPTVVAMNDGNAVLAGHSCDPTHSKLKRQHITYDPLTSDVTAVVEVSNERRDVGQGCASDVLPVEDYPRLHLIKTGDLMDAAGITRVAGGDVPRTWTLDRAQPFDCQDEWLEGFDIPAVLRFGGNTVQLITRDPADETETIEVIYAIGGGDVHDESACDATYAISDSVQRMQEPSDTALWETMTPLDFPRMNHNSVLLLDGSILVVGGEDNATGSCQSVLMAERYRPEEVFHNTNPGWNQMLPMAIGRAYHSVAGLLADGRVIVAGGVGLGGATGSWHTIEFYSPPYCFNPRPLIEASTVPTGTVTYGSDFFIDVRQVGSGTESEINRVVLLRPGAVTHAWDANQRYVELNFEEFAGTWDDRTLHVFIDPVTPNTPGSGDYMMPPGYYMLAVVDESQHPSTAEWIRIDH